jgi:CheY-like chemotaxis protein
MNFLIVEDNFNMRRVIRNIVAEFAGETHECSDGADALAAYAEHLPDWVLMDIRMREIDGIKTTRQILAVFPEANVMIVTEYDDAELRRSARDAGAREYVLKENLFEMSRILNSYAREREASE